MNWNHKRRLHVHSLNPKAKYKNDQEAQKVSARVSYARNPKIRIGHSYCILRMKQRFLQKKGTNIHCASQSFLK